MGAVTFIDTSVLCNLVPVPGRDQDAAAVKFSMKTRNDEGEQFILPITSVIETGNFIAQLADGGLRRQTAQKLHDILRFICAGQSPWVLHDVAWNRAFLGEMLDGGGTMTTYVEHAANKVGAGDLCIINERQQFYERSGIRAEIWTLDTGLAAYS